MHQVSGAAKDGVDGPLTVVALAGAAVAAESVPLAGRAPGAEVVPVEALLRSGEFGRLQDAIAGLRKRAESDPAAEAALDRALDEFNRPALWMSEPLDVWVAREATSDLPLLARGIHHTAVGWERRGNAFAPQTSEEQFAGMVDNFALAFADLDAALKRNPRQVHALAFMIEILMTMQEGLEGRKLMDKALAVSPLSLTIRWYFMSTLLPRWGGSVEAMAAFVEETRPLFERNPALRVLEGRVMAEIGDAFAGLKRYDEAVEAYTRALGTGPHWYFYRRRGEALLYSDHYAEAVADFDRALALRPTYAPAYEMRGWIRYATDAYPEAIADLSYAIELGRERATNYGQRGESYLEIGEVDKAVADLRRSVELGPGGERFRKLLLRAEAQSQ